VTCLENHVKSTNCLIRPDCTLEKVATHVVDVRGFGPVSFLYCPPWPLILVLCNVTITVQNLTVRQASQMGAMQHSELPSSVDLDPGCDDIASSAQLLGHSSDEEASECTSDGGEEDGEDHLSQHIFSESDDGLETLQVNDCTFSHWSTNDFFSHKTLWKEVKG
jgi:hypothetical protein